MTDFDITEETGSTIGGTRGESADGKNAFMGDEQKIYQLTGYGDPVYAEAITEVHHYDILMKIVLLNRT